MQKFKAISSLILLYAATLAVFSSCSRLALKPEIAVPSGQEMQLSAGSEGGPKTILFKTNTDWEVSVTQNSGADPSGWIKVSPLYGKAGDVLLTVDISENTSETARSAEIKVTAGSARQSFAVSQDAFVPLLTFPDPESGGGIVSLEAAAGSVVFNFTVNTIWRASVIDAASGKEASWLSVTPLSGSAGSVQLSISAAENTSSLVRTATLTVSAGSAKKSVSISQDFKRPLSVVDISSSVQRLADMQVRRLSHILIVNGNDDYTAVGGHTDSFMLTNTAERFSDGSWKSLSSIYPHDMGFFSRLKDGRTLIGGGCSSGWGVGQSSTAEIYDPSSHTFTSVGNMNVERCNARSATLSDGRVLVAGNWYNSSSIVDIYNPETKTFSSVSSSIDLSSPFVFPDSSGGALIFGRYTTYGSYISGSRQVFRFNSSTSTITDFQCDIFENWYPLAPDQDAVSGCDKQGRYILLGTNGKSSESEVEYKLMALDPLAGTFSLLTTQNPIPVLVPGTSERIGWSGKVIVNPDRSEAYLIGSTGGTDTSVTCYILTVNYQNGNMQLSYFGGLSHIITGAIWKLLPDGKLIAAGGSTNAYSYNFYPDSKVFKIKLF